MIFQISKLHEKLVSILLRKSQQLFSNGFTSKITCDITDIRVVTATCHLTVVPSNCIIKKIIASAVARHVGLSFAARNIFCAIIGATQVVRKTQRVKW